ncbi:helix-turn-helix transcriptional regulator [Streptomyces sp. NPDC003860]
MVRHGGAARAERVRDAAVRAARSAAGVDEFFDKVMRALSPVLRSDVWAGITVDPYTLMNTGGHYRHAVPLRYMPRMLDIEYREGDVNGLPDLARSPEPVRLLGEAVGGVRDRSPRYRDIIDPIGLQDEARILLRDRHGAWGALILGIDRGGQPFAPEARTVARLIAQPLGESLRRLHLTRRAREEAAPHLAGKGRPPGPALVILDEGYAPIQLTATAARWLDDLPAPGEHCPAERNAARAAGRTGCLGPGGCPAHVPPAHALPGGRLPGGLSPAVYGVAAAVRAPGSAGSVTSWAQTRTLGRARLHAWRLDEPEASAADSAPRPRSSAAPRVAVSVEAAGPGEHMALLAAAHGLTPRERDVTALVLRGHSTVEIGRLARLSPHTVQEHLKSVFEKTGVRSRRDLVATVFARHFEPALLCPPSARDSP